MLRGSTLTATQRPSARNLQTGVVGIWRLVKRVHSGTWTDLYRAQPVESTDLTRADYALKIGDPAHGEGIRQIQATIDAAGAARHPNLLAVLDGSVSNGLAYVVTPWLEGVNLQKWMEMHPWPRTPVCLWWVRQCAQALEVLHRAGWRHGDLKPENVVINARGHATLIDLGFARRLGDPLIQSTETSTDERELRGTLYYAAPELLDGRRLTAATDIYALGIILWQLRNQRITAEDALTSILQLEGTDDPIDRLIWDMTGSSANRRPSARTVANRLLRLEVELLADHLLPMTNDSKRIAS